MKSFTKRFFVALTIAGLASFTAMAKDKDKDKVARKDVTFTQDIMLNGTLLKAGQYQLKFDENTNELRILRNGKVKAETAAHLEPRTGKAKSTQIMIDNTGSGPAELRGVAFHGWDKDVMVNGSSSTSGSQ